MLLRPGVAFGGRRIREGIASHGACRDGPDVTGPDVTGQPALIDVTAVERDEQAARVGDGAVRPDQVAFPAFAENLIPPPWPTFSLGPAEDSAQTIRESRIRLAYRGAASILLLLVAGLVVHGQLGLSRRADLTLLAGLAACLAVLVAAVVSQLHVLTSRLTAGPTTEPAIASAPAGSREGQARSMNEVLVEQSRVIAEQVRVYQQLTTRQAQTAFRSSLSAMTLALAVLAVGAASSFRTQDSGARAVVAAVTVLGGALATFLGTTFLDMHRRANEQLNRSHAVPLAQHLAYFTFILAQHVEAGGARSAMIKDIVATTLKGVEVTLAGFLAERRTSGGRRRMDLGTAQGGADAR
jgi:hypothetical protein